MTPSKGSVVTTATFVAKGFALWLCVAACGTDQVGAPSPSGSSGGVGGSVGGSATSGSGGSLGGSSSGGSASGTAGASAGGDGGAGTAGATGGVAAGGGSSGSAGGGTAGSGGEIGGSGGQSGASGSPVGGSGATAGAGTGGASPVELTLITSGPNDYWKTDAALEEMSSGTASITVDENTTHQRWDGFGGTFNEMGWDALSVVGSELTRALTLLFHPQEGANFVYGRIPMGASDYAMSWYTLAETTDDYAMESFSIERDREMLIPYVKAAQQVRPDIRFFASPWVVPSWMMNGRNMRTDPQTLEAHALYFARFVQEYGAEGIPIESVHPQNEPGYARVTWTQSLFIDFIKSYLGPKFVELSIPAEVWCGTMSHPDDGTIATTLAADTEAMQYTKGFGLQWNLETTVAELAPHGPVMQTEHRCGNYNFSAKYWDQSRYDPNTAQNDHLYGEESWQLIRDWIVAGVNSYVAWNMVLDTQGQSLDGWPQNALLVVDRQAKELIVTPAYYVFRHYSRFLVPGATRIGLTGSNDALAFENPDGSIVTQVYNSGSAPSPTTVSVAGAFYQFDVPAHGWATLVTPST